MCTYTSFSLRYRFLIRFLVLLIIIYNTMQVEIVATIYWSECSGDFRNESYSKIVFQVVTFWVSHLLGAYPM